MTNTNTGSIGSGARNTGGRVLRAPTAAPPLPMRRAALTRLTTRLDDLEALLDLAVADALIVDAALVTGAVMNLGDALAGATRVTEHIGTLMNGSATGTGTEGEW